MVNEENEVGRILAVYFGLISSMELLNSYCEKRLAKLNKQFQTPREKYAYNNMKTYVTKCKWWYEQFQKEAYKLDVIIEDDNGNVINNPNEFVKIDENIKTGIGYIRFLLLFNNIISNCDNVKETLLKLESVMKTFIKTDHITYESINDFVIH